MGFLHRSWAMVFSLTLMLSGFSFVVNAGNTNGYPQYTEAACILLAEQMQRFKPQPHSTSYQSAAHNYSRHCQNPIAYTASPAVTLQPALPSETAGPERELQPAAAPLQQGVVTKVPVVQAAKPGLIDASGVARLFILPFFLVIGLAMMGLLAAWAWRRSSFGLTSKQKLGQQAERQLAKYLVDGLSEGFKHYRNIILTTEVGDLTEVDHLIVSPFGIFVIEVKNFKGWIFGGEKYPQWHVQNFKSKIPFPSPILQNYKHTQAVAHVLQMDTAADSGKIHSIIAFSCRGEFKKPMPAKVMYIEQVLGYIENICEQGRTLSDEALRSYIARLNQFADRSDALRPEHLLQQEGHQLLRELNGMSR